MGFKQPVPDLVHKMDIDTNITGSDNRSMPSRSIEQDEQQVADNQVVSVHYRTNDFCSLQSITIN